MKLIALAALLLPLTTYSATESSCFTPQLDNGDRTRPPVDVGTYRRFRFSTFSWEDATDPSPWLAEYLWPKMSVKAKDEMLRHIETYKCGLEDLTAWYKRGSPLLVVEVPCWNDVTDEEKKARPDDMVSYYVGWKHPLTLIVTADHTHIVMNYDDYEFKFGLKTFGVTDLDQDLKPELWLEGYTYECGEDDDPGCDGGYAIEIVEADVGILRKVPKKWKISEQ